MTITDEELVAKARDPRLRTLLDYLTADPTNSALRADAAEQALAVNEADIAREILAREELPKGARELNLLGLAQMQLGIFADAEYSFAALIESGTENPVVKFNLAWSLAMQKQQDRALDRLDDETTAALPQAAMLEVQLLHDLGKFDDAAGKARRHIQHHPSDPGLAAAVSVLALDIEDLDLARSCAETGGAHPDALTTLGTLALGDQQPGVALEQFDRALAANPDAPRALIGRGLVRLVTGEPTQATGDIDRGAELFDDHIGSWIAAGWAHLITGDRAKARDRFERALRIDENFGESHGSLAVIDALEGREDDARRKIEVARRLDRQCFSARLAETLLTAGRGEEEQARKLFDKILETPVNDRGDTAAAALTKLGLR